MDFLHRDKAAATALLKRSSSCIVALSGGVDSAVLLALAVEALGAERVLAVTGVSPAVPDADVRDAAAVARRLGVRHELVRTAELGRGAYRANRGDRCFHCRSELFDALERIRLRKGYARVAYGAIKEDESDVRPGMRAARERGVLAPLLEAGLGKEQVRRLARAAGLPVTDKAAAACLASRIPVGTPVTEGRLRQVERAEAALRRRGFGQVRVRHHGEVARLEVDEASMALLQDAAVRRAVAREVRGAGFRFVALDLEGYRTGSLNPVSAVTGRDRSAPGASSGRRSDR